MRSLKVNYGTIKGYALLGGGRVLIHVAELLQGRGYDVIVFSSPRLLEEVPPQTDQTLESALRDSNIEFRNISSPEDDPDLRKWIRPDVLAISFGAPWIFKRPIIELFGGRLLNCHAAMLPQDRGAGGYSWRIMRGDRRGASTLHEIDVKVDAGPVIKRRDYQFPESCRKPSDYHNIAIVEDIKTLEQFISQVEGQHSFDLNVQEEERSTYFPRLHTPSHGYLNWGWGSVHIENFVNAFDDPYDGATTFISGRLQEGRVRLKGCVRDGREGPFHPFQAGLVFRIDDCKLWISTSDHAVTFDTIISEDGSDIFGKIRVGDRLYTPQAYLDAALSYRAVYSSQGLISKERS